MSRIKTIRNVSICIIWQTFLLYAKPIKKVLTQTSSSWTKAIGKVSIFSKSYKKTLNLFVFTKAIVKLLSICDTTKKLWTFLLWQKQFSYLYFYTLLQRNLKLFYCSKNNCPDSNFLRHCTKSSKLVLGFS